MNLYKLLTALLCCVILAGLLPTTALAQDTVTSDNALTDGWTQCGTCEWMIDDDGVLTIRPLGDGSEGTLADWRFIYSSPWHENTAIQSVVVKAGVKAATCSGMFKNCTNLTTADLSGLDTGNVITMSRMFDSCSSLASLDLSNFDTGSVTHMNSMFYGCSNLASLDLRNFNTSNVTYMDRMFSGCSNLSSLDLSNFNTGSVTSMLWMFSGCSNLSSLNLSSFDTSSVTYMVSMFKDCSALNELTLGTNFSFKDGAVLPAPSTASPYTGKWTNGALSLTANELKSQYNGSTMAGTWIWETSQTNEDDQPHTSFAPAEDGSWYVYVNGEINTSVDNTLHFYNNAFFWIEKGKWNDRKHTFVDYDGAKFLVANGQVALEKNGLTQDPENEEIWYFCAGGKIQTQAKGLVMYDDEWFNVQGGKLDTTFSGYVDYDGSKFLVAAGRICKEVKGLVQDPDPNNAADWYYIADGQVTTPYTGLVLYNERWFYVENGKLNAGYTGPVEYAGQIFEVINGELP